MRSAPRMYSSPGRNRRAGNFANVRPRGICPRGENQMRRFVCRALVLLPFLLPTTLLAQQGLPAPAPELKKLEMFTGEWSSEGTMILGPPGTPPTKWTATSHGEWMEGNFFLVEHTDMDLSPVAKGKELAVMGFDADKKVYTYKSFSSMGQAEDSTGTVDGSTWTWLSDEHYGGMNMKGRYTMKILSPTSYTLKFEMS